ncbi:MAG: ATP-binding protein [Methylococcales bacterium]|nr:ATP-binding protein [Methylococcales bacterium]MDP3838850.1 ATP-binding protein [Methylococcales bacterium]
MNWITIVWPMMAASILTLALLHLVVWFKQRQQVAHLFFAIAALGVAVMSGMELIVMRSVSIPQVVLLMRWLHLPLLVVWIAIICYVRYYFNAGRLWLAWTACYLRIFALILSFTTGQNLFFSEITHLKQVAIFGGETISIAQGVLNPWYIVGPLSMVALVVFVVDASITLWHQGSDTARRRAIIFGCIAFFLLASVGHGVLVHTGLIHSPYLVSISFMPTLFAMSYELSYDVLHSAKLAERLQISIIKREQAELDMQTQRNALTHLSRVTLLGELSGSLAHELNQPLAAILSNAQAAQRFLAQENINLDEVRDILQDIVDEDKRAADIIQRLRLILKKADCQLQLLNVNEVVQDVLKLVRSDLKNRGVTVNSNLSNNIPVVTGDNVLIQQVLLNLMMNACDAVADAVSIEQRQIHIHTRWNGTAVQVAISDQGTGIVSDDIERVFEPFFTTKPQGMGLGLAICRTIIHSHKGQLWAENNNECGASFYFTLPAYSGETI